MENKLFKGLIDESMIANFKDSYNFFDDYFFITGQIPEDLFISVAAILSPVLAEVKGSVFWLTQKKDIVKLSNDLSRIQLDTRKKKEDIEKRENVFAVGQHFSPWHTKDFDWNNYIPETEGQEEKNWKLFMEVARIIQHFWTLKLKQDFPDREFIFEIGDGSEDFYGEYGVCLTFYEKV